MRPIRVMPIRVLVNGGTRVNMYLRTHTSIKLLLCLTEPFFLPFSFPLSFLFSLFLFLSHTLYFSPSVLLPLSLSVFLFLPVSAHVCPSLALVSHWLSLSLSYVRIKWYLRRSYELKTVPLGPHAFSTWKYFLISFTFLTFSYFQLYPNYRLCIIKKSLSVHYSSSICFCRDHSL